MKTVETNYQNIMFIFDILQKFPIKKRADVSHLQSLSAKIMKVMEENESTEKEIKERYLLVKKDNEWKPILHEWEEVKFFDESKKAEMLQEVFDMQWEFDINTHEEGVLNKALENALRLWEIKWAIWAKMFQEVEWLLTASK